MPYHFFSIISFGIDPNEHEFISDLSRHGLGDPYIDAMNRLVMIGFSRETELVAEAIRNVRGRALIGRRGSRNCSRPADHFVRDGAHAGPVLGHRARSGEWCCGRLPFAHREASLRSAAVELDGRLRLAG